MAIVFTVEGLWRNDSCLMNYDGEGNCSFLKMSRWVFVTNAVKKF